MVIKIHESCCSIFNELCFSLHHLAARSLFIIPLCLSFVKRFFKLFSSFFRSVPSEPCFSPRFASTCGLLSCSSDSIPHSTPLVKWFFKVFSGFLGFSCGKSLFHRNILPPYVIRQVLAYLSHILIHRFFLRRIMKDGGWMINCSHCKATFSK